VLDLAVPPRRIEAFDISHLQGTDSIASLIVFEDGKPLKSDYRLFGIASQSLLAPDDFRSMAEAVERRYRRVREEGGVLPDLVLVDGGRGQLQAALSAIDRVGLELPAVGLAKREEELWLPDRPEPVRLPRKDPALRLVQRVRDEAHRFAITYHRQKRSKRMTESALDGIPGLGEARRRAVLRHFGSLRKLRSATADEIAEVPGVGRRTAEAIVVALTGEAPPAREAALTGDAAAVREAALTGDAAAVGEAALTGEAPPALDAALVETPASRRGGGDVETVGERTQIR
jgi:excinuclease ABC subunit C